MVAGVLPLVALFQLTDGTLSCLWLALRTVCLYPFEYMLTCLVNTLALSGATGGLLRGAGKAPLGALINLSRSFFHPFQPDNSR